MGLLGARLVPLTRRYVPALRDGFAAAAAAETTLYRLPESLPAALGKHDAIGHAKAKQFAILAGRKFVGTAGLWPARFAGTELTIAIFDPAFRGKGIGTFAVRTLCAIAFRDRRLNRVELGVYPDNARAIACYERCLFAREALLRKFMYHDGRWRDLVWMSLLRPEWLERRKTSRVQR